MPEPERITCGGCGGVCTGLLLERTDTGVRATGPCSVGTAWFAHRVPAPGADAVAGGEVVAVEAALATAAKLLAGARAPLLYGFGRTSNETVAEAVALADRIGAAIDTAGPVLDGSGGRAVALRGASLATLGEIRDRPGAVLLWREDPVVSHPQLLERLALPDPARPLIAVGDPDDPATGRALHTPADHRVAIPADRDLDALLILRLMARDLPVEPAAAEGLDLDALRDLLARLRAHPHVVVIHGRGLGGGPGGHRRVLALHELVRELDHGAHAVSLALRTEPNAVGADDVLTWQTGFPNAVDLGSGHPRSLPQEGSAAALLAAGAVDLVVSVASDPHTDLPPAARAALADVPLIALDAVPTLTMRRADVAIATAAVGVNRAGTIHRMDGVPIPLGAPVPTHRPGEDEVLRALAAATPRRTP